MPAAAGAPNRQEPRLAGRMPSIPPDGRRACEHALDLRDRDIVLPAFLTVSLVPIKACDDFAIHDGWWHLYVRLSLNALGPEADGSVQPVLVRGPINDLDPALTLVRAHPPVYARAGRHDRPHALAGR